MSTIERMFLHKWKQTQLFVVLTSEELREMSVRIAHQCHLNEAEVLDHLTQVYNTWYGEQLARYEGSTALLEKISRLHIIENSKGILRWI